MNHKQYQAVIKIVAVYIAIKCNKPLLAKHFEILLEQVLYWQTTRPTIMWGKKWVFYTGTQFRKNHGCGKYKADTIMNILIAENLIEKENFGHNNRRHLHLNIERLLELAAECETEQQILDNAAAGFKLEVAPNEWLAEYAHLIWSLCENRKAKGLPINKAIQQQLLKELERIKASCANGAEKAIEALKYAVLQGNAWIAKIQKPVINGLDWILAKVEKFLIKDCGGLPVSVQTACSKAKRSIEREELRRQRQIKKCPNLALGHI